MPGTKPDYYRVLGVSPGATQEKIDTVYHERAKRLHPDTLGPDFQKDILEWAEEQMKALNEAYSVLGDPEARKAYGDAWKQESGNMEPSPQPKLNPPWVHLNQAIPGVIQKTSFIISNNGGAFTKIWISNPENDPDSWVKVTEVASLDPNQADELPLRVCLEARGKDWAQSYSKDITVRLINEETGSVGETIFGLNLRTKSPPHGKSTSTTANSFAASSTPSVTPSSKTGFWLSIQTQFQSAPMLGKILMIIIGIIVMVAIGWLIVLIILALQGLANDD